MSYGQATRELLIRYDTQGPRYTSYPTAPVWTEDFGADDWEAAMSRANASPDAPLSLYVHLPYCDNLCLFCGCSVLITKDVSKSETYVDAVLQEARLLANALPDRRLLGQHHWGGGTPTFLPPEQIRKLYRGIAELFPAADNAEISIEVDPRVTTFEQLAVLRELGFNRISMGIQDFTPAVQEAIHRVQSEEQTYALIEEARRVGFSSVNVDLIYGLPFQQLQTFSQTLQTITGWNVDRVACYSYAHVPWLKKHQDAIPTDALPDRDTKFALLELALGHMAERGYEAIGFDHFAQPNDSLCEAARSGRLHRNFQGYSTRMTAGRDTEDMIALGMTAIGEAGAAFGQNHKTRRAWQDSVDAGQLPTLRGWRRSADDEERRRIILDLMCDYRVEYAHFDGFRERFARALEELAPMEQDGLIVASDERLEVTDLGRLFLRNICMPFDAYLDKQRKSKGPVFSRTV